MLPHFKSQFLYKPKNIETREMLAQIQEQKSNQKEKIKLSQILKNATERQCFGQFMKFSKITANQPKNAIDVCLYDKVRALDLKS